jgi:hypothetical protein
MPLGQPQVGVVTRFPAQVKQFDAELEHVLHYMLQIKHGAAPKS